MHGHAALACCRGGQVGRCGAVAAWRHHATQCMAMRYWSTAAGDSSAADALPLAARLTALRWRLRSVLQRSLHVATSSQQSSHLHAALVSQVLADMHRTAHNKEVRQGQSGTHQTMPVQTMSWPIRSRSGLMNAVATTSGPRQPHAPTTAWTSREAQQLIMPGRLAQVHGVGRARTFFAM